LLCVAFYYDPAGESTLFEPTSGAIAESLGLDPIPWMTGGLAQTGH
jgi:hypothetical protein